MRVARVSFWILALGWLALLLAAPLAAFGAPASGIAYAFGSLICHQQPARSFQLAGAQLPVCARCCGLYAGAAVGVFVWGLAPTRHALRALLVIAAAPTALTWILEVLRMWSPANATRFLAALPLGAAVAVTVNYLECVRQPRRTAATPTRTRM